jgi:trehalose 6-phosphate synthase/phosphatase
MEDIVRAYKRARRRLLLLDYDGTLIKFAPTPDAAHPTHKLLALLDKLSREQGNTVVIISGRDRETLEHTFAGLPVSLAAEHGCFLKNHEGTWQNVCDTDQSWKLPIRQAMNAHALTLPGSFVEEKASALVWHYRQAAASAAKKAARKLSRHLAGHIQSNDLRLVPGHKIVEVRKAGTDKGQAAEHWLGRESWDFVLSAGDDTTDEDMFAAMPSTAFTIKIGRGHTIARQRLSNPAALRTLLASWS